MGLDNSRTLSLLTANVLTHNHQAHLLLNQIHQLQPDIVLTLESDEWWQSQLDTLMDCGYHHTVKIPLDNLYGMHLYSRLELANSEIRHWVTETSPPSNPD